VARPELFDAVVADKDGTVREIQVKQEGATSHWVWGAFKLTGAVMRELHDLWLTRNPRDPYVGTLVNEWLARGGKAQAVRAGESYVDVGTLNGYREAIQLLNSRPYRNTVSGEGTTTTLPLQEEHP
jgi:NDP-sugar pyrophosphorylase family protein